MSDVDTERDLGPEPQHAVQPNLGWALAGLSVGAAVIHFAMTPIHASSGWQDPLGFAAAGWFQLLVAGAVLAGRAGRRTFQAAVLGNVAIIAVWAWSRTVGLPWGETPGVAEEVGAIDAAAVALQVGVIVVALRLLVAPDAPRRSVLAPTMAAIAALGLATTVIASPDAAEHGHGDQLTGLDALRAEIDEERCDLGFNPPAYWQEASYLGIDTYWGNNPPAVEGEAAGGHGHGGESSSVTTTTEPDPNGGRGTAGLDELVSATDLAATSEILAATFVSTLSDASDEDYDAWLWWLRSSGALQHEHSSTHTEEDGSGHGGHVGPQPWVAMTDQAQCDQLADELDLARETALSFPTAQDALDAGYQRTTPYLPGIAAHYMKYDLVDGVFEIDQPEMLLYDGNGPEAAIVGLSYYLYHKGDSKPTQGFTGDNDHGHRHLGLCSARGGGVIGDSTTSAEDCEARGGTKSDGSAGWMSHAWVVPGCESPWGVFSAATPVLDQHLQEGSGVDGGSCASSNVRDRYGMDEPGAAGGESAARATSDTVGG